MDSLLEPIQARLEQNAYNQLIELHSSSEWTEHPRPAQASLDDRPLLEDLESVPRSQRFFAPFDFDTLDAIFCSRWKTLADSAWRIACCTKSCSSSRPVRLAVGTWMVFCLAALLVVGMLLFPHMPQYSVVCTPTPVDTHHHLQCNRKIDWGSILSGFIGGKLSAGTCTVFS